MRFLRFIGIIAVLSGIAFYSYLNFYELEKIDIFDNKNNQNTEQKNEVTNPLPEDSIDSVDSTEKEIATPPPIKQINNTITHSELTSEGSIIETNNRRILHGLPTLKRNELLTQAAQNKVDDMFARQYFEHNSPTGEGPSDLAEDVGYQYIMIGENLALGNYENDYDLVEAWMNSPGHRENILKKEYSEIGIAVGYGNFEGDEVWLAVQEFGRPASECPAPNEALGTSIESNKSLVKDIANQISILLKEIENSPNKNSQEYRDRISVYNALVEQYNKLGEELETDVNIYNNQVLNYNNCI